MTHDLRLNHHSHRPHLRESPKMTTPMSDREALARIIDPAGWAVRDRRYESHKTMKWPTDCGVTRAEGERSADSYTDESLAKADQWLARSSGGGEAGPWKLFDPEPNNHHSALYLQFPGGFLADISHDDREGHDIALGQWIVDTLNAAKGTS